MNRIKRKATGVNNENNSNLVGRGGRGARGSARGGEGSRGGANAGKRPSERSTISEDDEPMKKIAVSTPSKLNIK